MSQSCIVTGDVFRTFGTFHLNGIVFYWYHQRELLKNVWRLLDISKVGELLISINSCKYVPHLQEERRTVSSRGAYIKVILSTPYVSQDIYKKMINPKGYLKQMTFYRWIFSLKFLLK